MLFTLPRPNFQIPRAAWVLGLLLAFVPVTGSRAASVDPCEGTRVERSLRGGEVHTFQCHLRAGDYVELAVEQQGVDVVLTFLDPSGRGLAEFDSPRGNRGVEMAWLAARESGAHGLRVATAYTDLEQGRYRITLRHRRPASARDRHRSAAREAIYPAGPDIQQEDPRELRRVAALYAASREHARQAGDPAGEAEALAKLARVRGLLGETSEVERHLRRAEELWRASDRPDQAVRARIGLGYVYLERGEAGRAHELWRRTLGELPSSLLRRRAELLGSLSLASESLGRLDEALVYESRALELWRGLENPAGLARSLRHLGLLHRAAGRPEAARAGWEEALSVGRVVRHQDFEPRLLADLGRLKVEGGEVAAGLERLHRAEALSRQRGLRRAEGMVVFERAETLGFLGESAAALDAFARSAALLESLDDVAATLPLAALARHQAALGRHAEALDSVERGIALVESRRGRLGDSELFARFRAVRHALYRLRIELLRSRDPGTVLAAYEASKARGLLEDGAAPLSARALEAARGSLPDDILILAYGLGEERSLLFALDRRGLSIRDLPGEAELERSARRIHRLLGARESDDRAAWARADADLAGELRSASLELLGPVASRIRRASRLVIVPDGALHLLPFAALGSPGGAPDEPLVVSHELSYAPSLSTFLGQRRGPGLRTHPPERGVALFADPAYADHGPLPGARSEAEAISTLAGSDALLALDVAASRRAVLGTDLVPFEILHFATHAEVDTEQAEGSSLVLAQVDAHGRRLDGHLGLDEIRQLDLRARLVVLSACRTALGPPLPGEGLLSLARGFLAAGASSVMASLWSPRDNATSELMQQFYRGHLREGLSPSAALRAAQLQMLGSRWHEPYYWAPFVLIEVRAGV